MEDPAGGILTLGEAFLGEDPYLEFVVSVGTGSADWSPHDPHGRPWDVASPFPALRVHLIMRNALLLLFLP